MKIIPINFMIASEELVKSSPEDVEEAIKNEILKNITEAITPMFDNEGFVDMIPSEDGEGFDIKINLMIGSANEYIDATVKTTTNIVEILNKTGLSENNAKDVAAKSTQPLVELVS